jgi:RHS repeat-associated protein
VVAAGRSIEFFDHDWRYLMTPQGLTAADSALSFGRIDYDYDDVGNRLQKRVGPTGQQDVWDYIYPDPPTTITRVDETPYGGGTTQHPITHDGAGNLTLDELSTYDYDPRNTLDSQQSGGSDRFRWTFNAAGLRVDTEGPLPGSATVTHHLLLDGMLGHEVYTDGGIPTEERSYVYLSGRLLARLAPDGSAEHVISDHIAFPLAVTDDDGEVLWEAENRPFGEMEGVLAGTQSHDPRLRYPGQWVVDGVPVDTTEVFANGYRWYRAAWGRYSQSDPIGLEGGQHLFLYTFANPLRIVDPLGLYGTNDCSYYDRRCRESGGRYYCEIAPFWCDDFFEKYPDPDPDSDNDYEGWPRCVRKCLQDCDEDYWRERRKCLDSYPYGPDNPDPDFDNFSDDAHRACHVKCYTGCASWQWAVVGGDWSPEP